MFKNLTAGQWIAFIVLTVFTIFGGLLYLIAEAYFSRNDRDFTAAHGDKIVVMHQTVHRSLDDPFIVAGVMFTLMFVIIIAAKVAGH